MNNFPDLFSKINKYREVEYVFSSSQTIVDGKKYTSTQIT